MITLTLTVLRSTLASESDVYRRQILMSKGDPRTVKVKIFLIAVDPQHRYSNEAERANQGIYDDFKLKRHYMHVLVVF